MNTKKPDGGFIFVGPRGKALAAKIKRLAGLPKPPNG